MIRELRWPWDLLIISIGDPVTRLDAAMSLLWDAPVETPGVAVGTRGSSQRRSTRPRFDSASLATTGIPADVR
jgi:hypothetical protein